MPRKTTINSETVGEAVDSLVQEGLDPTLERVRSKLGGGSFTTINRVLATVLAQRQTHAAQISDVPPDLVALGQQSIATIYAAVQRQAASKIELIETNSRKLIDAANLARAEAALEIERLEREAEHAAETLAVSQRATQDALTRAERAEATALAAREEIQRLERAIAGAQADAQAARESDQEAQRRAARSEEARRAFEFETRKEIDRLQKSLATSDAQVATLKEKVERLTQTVQAAEGETARLRQERDQLQTLLAKAEAGFEAAQADLEKTAKALERAQDSERRARDETAELRGQIKAGEDRPKK
jgi:chromosome segregation ATPase